MDAATGSPAEASGIAGMRLRLDRFVRAHEVLTVALLTLLAALPRLANLDAPLLERHWIRQTQTAWTSLLFARDGIDLLRPRVPDGGPPYISGLEFPIVQAIVALISKTGLTIEAASRLVGVAGYALLGVATYAVVRRLAGRRTATLSLIALSATPFALEWGRSAIVDVPAAGLAMAGLDRLLAYRESRSRRVLLLGTLALAVAASVKVTVAVFLLPIAFLFVPAHTHRATPPWRQLGLVLASLSIVGAAVAWNVVADVVKAANDMPTRNVSHIGIYVGTLADRLRFADYVSTFGRMAALLGGIALPVWLFFAARSATSGSAMSQRWTWAGVAFAAFAPFVAFWPMFVIHAYYMAAVAGPIAALIGLGASHLLERPKDRNSRRMLGVLTAGWILTFAATYDYWSRAFDPTSDPGGILPLAAQLRSISPSDEPILLVQGPEHGPSVLYYADRMGWTLIKSAGTEVVVRARCAEGIQAFQIEGATVRPACP